MFIKKILQKNTFSLDRYKGNNNLHLGCGRKRLSDFINVDYYTLGNHDVVADLNKPLPFRSNSFDLIYADNVAEHISNLPGLIQECHRILKSGGYLIIIVPYFKSRNAYVDPTHQHYFTLASLNYFVRDTWYYENYRFFDEAFSSMKVLIDTARQNKSIWRRMMENHILLKPDRFEYSWLSNLFIIDNITSILRK